MSAETRLFCLYSNERCDDSGIESLKIFSPVRDGYINFNIVHSVAKGSKCDTWRLSAVYFCNSQLERVRPITRSGAEWEMAIKLQGRPDFIGGYAHGDEVFEKISVKIDGCEVVIDELIAPTPFDSLSFEVYSTGFDPNDSTTEALSHYKKITVDSQGVKVEQRVDWLIDCELGRSYMAMMPPLKSVTDHYYTDRDTVKKPIIIAEDISGNGACAVYLCGDSGFTFGMRVGKYLSHSEKGNTYLITDNRGVPYNKMYFILHHAGFVNKGDAWNTETVYTVELK